MGDSQPSLALMRLADIFTMLGAISANILWSNHFANMSRCGSHGGWPSNLSGGSQTIGPSLDMCQLKNCGVTFLLRAKMGYLLWLWALVGGLLKIQRARVMAGLCNSRLLFQIFLRFFHTLFLHSLLMNHPSVHHPPLLFLPALFLRSWRRLDT